MRKIVRDKQELPFPQKLKHDIISHLSCAEIRSQVIWQCRYTTFLHHPLPPCLVPWDTNPASKSVEQGGSMETANPCASRCGDHPDKTTPPGSQRRQQGQACSLTGLESPRIAVQHQIVSSLQSPWWQCSGKLPQEMFELESPPPSTQLPCYLCSPYW